jgi:hypothetical protein
MDPVSAPRRAAGGWVALLLLANCALLALRDWTDWDGWLAAALLAAIGVGFWLAVVAWVVLRLRERRELEGMTRAEIVGPWLWPALLAIVLSGALVTGMVLID